MKIDRMKLLAELDKRNITQTELATAAHISCYTVTGILQGKKTCKAKTALRIAMALDMPVEDLLSEV